MGWGRENGIRHCLGRQVENSLFHNKPVGSILSVKL